jgi:hypothetical protein
MLTAQLAMGSGGVQRHYAAVHPTAMPRRVFPYCRALLVEHHRAPLRPRRAKCVLTQRGSGSCHSPLVVGT